MTAKEYLKQLRCYEIKLAQLEEQIKELRVLSTGGGSLGNNPDKVQSSVHNNSMNKVVKYVDLENELLVKQVEYAKLKNKIISEIHQLEDSRYVQILYMHYVNCKRLEEIACQMRKSNGEPYSYDHINTLHGEALIEFDKIISKPHGNPI